MAKIGYLYLRRGRWNGKQITPESRAEALYINQKPQPTNLKPADGLIALDDTLYWYAERKSDGRLSCQLLTSKDHGRTWIDHSPFFQENGKFAFTGIIQFGKNYADAPGYLGKYLYVFDGGTKAEGHPHYSRTDMLLARIPLKELSSRHAVEFFAGTPRRPSWTSDMKRARPMFRDKRDWERVIPTRESRFGGGKPGPQAVWQQNYPQIPMRNLVLREDTPWSTSRDALQSVRFKKVGFWFWASPVVQHRK